MPDTTCLAARHYVNRYQPVCPPINIVVGSSRCVGGRLDLDTRPADPIDEASVQDPKSKAFTRCIACISARTSNNRHVRPGPFGNDQRLARKRSCSRRAVPGSLADIRPLQPGPREHRQFRGFAAAHLATAMCCSDVMRPGAACPRCHSTPTTGNRGAMYVHGAAAALHHHAGVRADL